MMKHRALTVLLSYAVITQVDAASYQYEKRQVVYKNLVANLYVPLGVSKPPVVIAFGGSDGGLTGADPASELLAPHGIAVLAIAYFKAQGLPPTLDAIPLEYFMSAVDYVYMVRGLDANRIGVVSGSRGSEAAMLLATHDRRIKSVALTTPSNVAWYGRTTDQSAWTINGAPVPALRLGLTSDAPQLSRFEAALSDKRAVARARFALEKVNGPILLLSAEKDAIWPSYAMSISMVAYLKEHRFPHRVTHVSYPTGHGFSQAVVPGLKATVVNHFLTTLAQKKRSE